VSAVGPLDPLKLGPAGAQEGHRTVALAEGSTGGTRVAGCDHRPTATTGPAAAATTGSDGGSLKQVVLRDLLADALSAVAGLGGHGDATGAADESGVELVDVSGGVVERTGHVGPDRLARRRSLDTASGRGASPHAALLCTFTVTSHCSAPALTGLPMAGVLATPATVLTQRHPVRVVALALVGLVVAMLALLAGEGDSDSDISASHWSKSLRRC
jgi:hypothetical protein